MIRQSLYTMAGMGTVRSFSLPEYNAQYKRTKAGSSIIYNHRWGKSTGQ